MCNYIHFCWDFEDRLFVYKAFKKQMVMKKISANIELLSKQHEYNKNCVKNSVVSINGLKG